MSVESRRKTRGPSRPSSRFGSLGYLTSIEWQIDWPERNRAHGRDSKKGLGVENHRSDMTGRPWIPGIPESRIPGFPGKTPFPNPGNSLFQIPGIRDYEPLKLMLNRKLISRQPYIQMEWKGALFPPWSIGYNFIKCHFYENFRSHGQKRANVKSSDFPSHGPHVFPFLQEPKIEIIVGVKKVGSTFRIISQKWDKILSWDFDMIFGHNTAF